MIDFTVGEPEGMLTSKEAEAEKGDKSCEIVTFRSKIPIL